jgi:hypothetical protein
MKLALCRGFAFVGTPATIADGLPFALFPGVVLRVATNLERRRIKRYLRDLGGHMHNYEPFEYDYSSTELEPLGEGAPPVYQIDYKRLPSSHWRYYVVSVDQCTYSDPFGEPIEFTRLRVSLQLTCYPLRLGPFFMPQWEIGDFTADWEHFTGEAPHGSEPVSLDAEYLADLRACYLRLTTVTREHAEIGHSIRLFGDLPDRKGHNELSTLGLFSVIESLLTHNPRGEMDSISHQIRKKVVLVEKRLRMRINYVEFGQASHDTVWTKLYELRSRIAHGSPVAFNKSLAILGDAYQVELFLRATLRSLLRGAIEEPDLFVDLKAV